MTLRWSRSSLLGTVSLPPTTDECLSKPLAGAPLSIQGFPPAVFAPLEPNPTDESPSRRDLMPSFLITPPLPLSLGDVLHPLLPNSRMIR